MNVKLTERMLSTIRRFSMIEPGEKVLVAVSGGPDSVALLYALHSISKEIGISLHAAHLNHSFRGEESDADEQYVSQLAEKLEVPFTSEKIDVPAIRETLRLSPEEAARLVRYEFLERVAAEIQADRIAVGHTADDQVETVILNLLRGTGIDGLAGMPPVRNKIIRPLVEVRRSAVEEYVEHLHLHPRIDSSNLTASYTRNRIRLDLLPLLRREYNPELDTAVLRLLELARADSAYLNVEVQKALGKLVTSRKTGSVVLDAAELSALPLAVKRRVLREALREIRGGLADVGFIHVDELVRLLEAESNFEVELPGGAFARRRGGSFVLLSSKPVELPIIYCHEVKVPGATSVREIDATLVAELVSKPTELVLPRGSGEIVLDYGRISGTLVVRNWRPGDRIRPLGMHGRKKVQDIFVDGKIPREARHRIPLIADEQKVVWVAGLVMSEEVKITEATQEFLSLRARPCRTCGPRISVV